MKLLFYFFKMPYKDKKQQHKYTTIYRWKSRGVISDDYNKLYELNMSINNCQLCNILFDNVNPRCLDHDHATGLYRQTICQNCNKSFDRTPNKMRKDKGLIKHKYIYFNKKVNAYTYQRRTKDKRISKRSTSLIKLLAFSFIQQLKITSSS